MNTLEGENDVLECFSRADLDWKGPHVVNFDISDRRKLFDKHTDLGKTQNSTRKTETETLLEITSNEFSIRSTLLKVKSVATER